MPHESILFFALADARCSTSDYFGDVLKYSQLLLTALQTGPHLSSLGARSARAMLLLQRRFSAACPSAFGQRLRISRENKSL